MIDFDDLDTNPNQPTAASLKAEEIRKGAHIANGGEAITSFTCPKCIGRGYVTYGYVNIKSYTCGWCKGAKKVTQARIDNIERSKKSEQTAKANHAKFLEEHDALIQALHEIRSWHTFAASLLDQLNDGKRWSVNQIEAAERSIAKVQARNEERRQQRILENEKKSGEVEISAIMALFATATDNDIKRPIFRADTMTISKAPMNGRNAGALYVVDNNDVYLGKIIDNKFHASRDANNDTLAALQAIAQDPLAESIKYARRTGNCGCCGRELVDPISIRSGIGPICAEKWGLDYRRELARDELKAEKEG